MQALIPCDVVVIRETLKLVHSPSLTNKNTGFGYNYVRIYMMSANIVLICVGLLLVLLWSPDVPGLLRESTVFKSHHREGLLYGLTNTILLSL